jgi:hypothetical protein
VIQKKVSDLFEALTAEKDLWIRVCAIQPEQTDKWSIVTLDITARAQPPTWKSVQWLYPRAILHAGVFPGAIVRGWLELGFIDLGEQRAELFELDPNDACSIDHRSSGSSAMHGKFVWPYDEWRIPIRNSAPLSVSDVLVGDGERPTFLNYSVAIAALLGVDLPPGGGFNGPSGVYRKQDLRGRIAGVHVYPTEIKVDLDGVLLGSVLELAGDRPGPGVPIFSRGHQTVSLPIPGQVLPNAWIALIRDRDWLDRRFLTYPYATGESEDVDYWVDNSSRLEVLVSTGEGPTTEFKETVPDDRIKMMKTAAAFSNGNGGTILIGVAKDGTIVGAGTDIASPDGRDRLADMVRNWINPLPNFNIETWITEDGERPVVALMVEKGPQPPYGAGTKPTDLLYYVRRGASTFIARPEQVRELARALPAIEQNTPFANGLGLNAFG